MKSVSYGLFFGFRDGMIFGGATSHILANATIPVLLAQQRERRNYLLCSFLVLRL